MTSDSKPFIQVSDVDMVYGHGPGSVDALSRISLEVGRGEFLSIIGPSGCGKSTLLRILGGLQRATAGEVRIGDAANDAKAFRDRSAMVFQSFALLPWCTIVDNVAFPLEARGVPRQERRERALELLEMVDLQDFATKYPNTLSGGMQQRVGLARALAADPEVLLMDEPFGALDALTRSFMQDELLRTWSTDHRTVVFVTHSIDEAVYLSDRVVVLAPRPGRVAEILDITLPRPRGEEARMSPVFLERSHHIRQLLASLMGQRILKGIPSD